MFPGCADLCDLAGGLDRAWITDVRVNMADKTLAVSAHFDVMPSPVDIELISGRIRDDYGLSGIGIIPDYPHPASEPADTPQEGTARTQKGEVLLGRTIRQQPVPMNSLSLESGKVTVEGDVFAVSSRQLQKRGGAVLAFDMTDRSNSIRVTKYLRADDDQSILKRVSNGDHLTVQGEIAYSKFDDDMVLDPRNIVRSKRQIRPDNAPVKRVELHLHTNMSALDALTNPEEAVKRAAYWGMPAVAVTDHGVAQAFPDMWKAGRKYGVKIIYGLEAYYVNDMDGNKAVIGKSRLPLETEFVAFDSRRPA